MADLSANLKSYLSKSKSDNRSSKSTQDSPASSWQTWFSAKPNVTVRLQPDQIDGDQDPLMSDQDESNGWFQQAQSDPIYPVLNKKQRILGFMFLLLAGIGCFVLAWCFLPLIVVKPRKFALLYTMGSLFTIGSFSILWGPANHARHLCSMDRLPFTATYFGTIAATLYFVFVTRSVLLTVICSLCQLIALLWYIVSYIPGGQRGLSFFTKLFASFAGRTISSTLPV